MTEEDLHSEGGERESEEASSEFDELFSEESEESNEDQPVTREEFNKLIKGVKNLATDKGRKAKAEEETKSEPEAEATEVTSEVPSSDIGRLFQAQIPETEFVSDDLKQIADAKYNGNIIAAWDGEPWLQEKAKTLNDAKVEEEKNKAKIEKPSTGNVNSKKNLASVKAEDVADLSPDDKLKWIAIQAEKESNDS